MAGAEASPGAWIGRTAGGEGRRIDTGTRDTVVEKETEKNPDTVVERIDKGKSEVVVVDMSGITRDTMEEMIKRRKIGTEDTRDNVFAGTLGVISITIYFEEVVGTDIWASAFS
mmetsp:Transcript_7887/g.17119  ORF Transcript_7887/g.17119 Transcript_7887/m.17119 type:complete len:114 (+) Transcript_7887:963-1304(+)